MGGNASTMQLHNVFTQSRGSSCSRDDRYFRRKDSLFRLGSPLMNYNSVTSYDDQENPTAKQEILRTDTDTD